MTNFRTALTVIIHMIVQPTEFMIARIGDALERLYSFFMLVWNGMRSEGTAQV